MLALCVFLEHEIEGFASLLLVHHAVLVEGGRRGQDASERRAMLLFEVRQLEVGIFVDVTTLHQILRVLHDGHEVAACNLFVAAAHLDLLHDKHGEALEQVEV